MSGKFPKSSDNKRGYIASALSGFVGNWLTKVVAAVDDTVLKMLQE